MFKMFKKNAEKGSSMCVAEAKWYVGTRDGNAFIHRDFKEDEFEEFERVTEEREIRMAADVFIARCDVDEDGYDVPAEIPFHEKASRYIDVPCEIAFFRGRKITMVTASGRALTEKEHDRFMDDATKAFGVIGSTIGAIFMKVEIDGEETVFMLHDRIYCKI